jgi:hypothetical protein
MWWFCWQPGSDNVIVPIPAAGHCQTLGPNVCSPHMLELAPPDFISSLLWYNPNTSQTIHKSRISFAQRRNVSPNKSACCDALICSAARISCVPLASLVKNELYTALQARFALVVRRCDTLTAFHRTSAMKTVARPQDLTASPPIA